MPPLQSGFQCHRPQHSSEDNSVATCWICLDERDPRDLITPCACQGTVAHVHESCLVLWIQQQVLTTLKYSAVCRRGEFARCPNCLTPYQVRPAQACGDSGYGACCAPVSLLDLLRSLLNMESALGRRLLSRHAARLCLLVPSAVTTLLSLCAVAAFWIDVCLHGLGPLLAMQAHNVGPVTPALFEHLTGNWAEHPAEAQGVDAAPPHPALVTVKWSYVYFFVQELAVVRLFLWCAVGHLLHRLLVEPGEPHAPPEPLATATGIEPLPLGFLSLGDDASGGGTPGMFPGSAGDTGPRVVLQRLLRFQAAPFLANQLRCHLARLAHCRALAGASPWAQALLEVAVWRAASSHISVGLMIGGDAVFAALTALDLLSRIRKDVRVTFLLQQLRAGRLRIVG